MRISRGIGLSVLVACLAMAPTSGFGAGFALFEHGARAVGLGGAFGATADDPTAIYYNPAGISFLQGTQMALGVELITESSTLNGANPYPGQGYTVDMKKQIFVLPQVFFTGELTPDLHWGFGIYAPFGLGTWWPDGYAGKYISGRVDLKTFNFNPTLSYKVTDHLALAAGVDYFYSALDLSKELPVIDPYTQQAADVGHVHLYTDYKGALGWNVGMLGKLDGGFSIGLTYRSNVKIDYTGTASFTQHLTGTDFDPIVASLLPFSSKPKAKTSIKYPDETRAALAWHGSSLGIEFDWVRMGWSSFKNLPIELVGYPPPLSETRPENYRDSDCYRLGVEYKASPSFALQFGVLKDKTPVPTESVSPLLPDATRKGASIGASFGFSSNTHLDVSYMYLKFDDRSTQGMNYDRYEGSYKTKANLLGITVVHKF